MVEPQLITDIEQALTGLVKLMKAQRFYPVGHPSLRAAVAECINLFQPMLEYQAQQAIQVAQTGFSLDGQKIGANNPALPELARLLAERRVKQLIFLADLPDSEILLLLEGLATPAEEIYNEGGLAEVLQNRHVASIWINESSLDEALKKREKLEENPPVEMEELQAAGLPEIERSDLAQKIRQLVQQLSENLNDDAYQSRIAELVNLAPVYFEQAGPPAILRILPLLLTHSREAERSRGQRRSASGALDRLLSDQVVTQLLGQLRTSTLTPQQLQRLHNFIIALGVRIAPQMLQAMSSEEDGTVRKRLTILLGRMGEPLLDLLRETVHSNTWYVVRNAVVLLGDLRLESGIDILPPLIDHPDQRVRRALIRSLAMIGGDKAVPPLVKLTQDPSTSLRRPAVKALGATKSPAAVRPLLRIAQMFDPFARHTEIRSDAVAALGTLGVAKAIPPLTGLARRPNLLRLKRVEELRAEIILALGKLGNEKLAPKLEKWRQSAHGIVRRAAEQSITNLTRKNDIASAD